MNHKNTVERRILESPNEPSNKSWLWLHRKKDGVAELKEFVNGSWVSISNGISNDQQGSVKPDPPVVPTGGVTKEYLEERLTGMATLSKVTSMLAEYAKKSDIPTIPDVPDITPIMKNLKTVSALVGSLSSTVSSLQSDVANCITYPQMVTYVAEQIPENPPVCYLADDAINIVVQTNQ